MSRAGRAPTRWLELGQQMRAVSCGRRVGLSRAAWVLPFLGRPGQILDRAGSRISTADLGGL